MTIKLSCMKTSTHDLSKLLCFRFQIMGPTTRSKYKTLNKLNEKEDLDPGDKSDKNNQPGANQGDQIEIELSPRVDRAVSKEGEHPEEVQNAAFTLPPSMVKVKCDASLFSAVVASIMVDKTFIKTLVSSFFCPLV